MKPRNRSSIKTDCQSVIHFKYFVAKAAYVITSWVDTHNHPMLEPKHLQFVPRNRVINEVQEGVIDINLMSGMRQRCIYEAMSRSHGGRQNLGFLRVDLKNFIRIKREKEMALGEATVYLKWFRDQARLDPDFYYDM